MAAQNGKRAASGKGSTRSTGNRRRKKKQEEFSAEVRGEVLLLSGIAVTILLFLCNFHIIGKFGNAVSGVMFGVFGILAYIVPIVAFFGILFGVVNIGSHTAAVKLTAGTILFLDFEVIAALLAGVERTGSKLTEYYTYGKEHLLSGGVIGSLLAKGLVSLIGIVGAIALALIVMIICMVLMTEKSFVKGVAGRGRRIYDTAREDIDRCRQLSEIHRENRELREEERSRRESEYEGTGKTKGRSRRIDQKVSGVASNLVLPEDTDRRKNTGRKPVRDSMETTEKSRKEQSDLDDLSNITIKGMFQQDQQSELSPGYSDAEPLVKSAAERKKTHRIQIASEDAFDMEAVSFALENSADKLVEDNLTLRRIREEQAAGQKRMQTQQPPDGASTQNAGSQTQQPSDAVRIQNTGMQTQTVGMLNTDRTAVQKKPKPYKRPPMTLLKKNSAVGNHNSEMQLKETALQLRQTLKTFGVNVTITDISQGPAVTRYELQPEMGVKVSKIVNLADDIKLNLAATDIRIEAPIPGKAAIGIEVPNKENSMVLLRDLLETKTFQDFPSNIGFAVGKDIAGQTIVADIAKMPHVLIAGSTGSGKSVCINTLIMSILYKASPEDVKLIMVDPKVVELSVYNGIPHLLLPVVTDPKKASAALQWGVKEMTDRYKKFEDMHVRDLKGYNKKVEEMTTNDGQPLPEKLPQIVIIVDELADLMMVAPGEVEESICRLAQLARAAGIHLVIATQRPSVDVITGLIKANMPSRIAFAVSSGVDSRTILDMVGAEKLLGKGDMLFYPQGYPKPVRVQGAFVSDKEVADVVDYIIANNDPAADADGQIEQQMLSMASASDGNGAKGQDVDDKDIYFADAGRFVIEKDKASIGMFQRVFKIGFNRAARIMDQLCDYGVVGEEEGTKPRKVLMTMEEFEQLLEELP